MTHQYDVKCPICGTMNKGLYLNETDGWMICEHCGAEVKSTEYENTRSVRIPIYTLEQLSKRLAEQEVAV